MPRKSKLLSWLPALNYQVWVLAAGRLLSQTGSGFTLFYAPIFFVNQVGLSATQVGLGLGSASISGVFGRLLGGSFADSQFWGRRRTLLLSAVLSAIASIVLAISSDFPVFVAGNLLMGLGIGLYWPANEAMVADLTAPAQRNEAFALTRLSDSLGLGLGVVLGGLLVGMTGAYRALFVIDAISFVVLFGVVYWAIAESNQSISNHEAIRGWQQALRDRRLLTYAVANVLFTTYLVQINSTMPLYFTNFLSGLPKGFSPPMLSALFTWHMVVSVLCQLPAVRVLNRFSRARGLTLSAVLWGVGFLLVWVTGVVPSNHLLWAILALGVLALATVTYMPSASSITVELAPESLRGVYLAVNSQCWAIGAFIGPPLGGWALDQSPFVAHSLWIGLALSVSIAILVLQVLDRMMQCDLPQDVVRPKYK
ncbi:MFS transporter [Stenomitos frigidus]|uniref:MFS transporter n=1 Tax=Stenomitos frigidus ULC18 TaxID=2107698 RepID=A0A2T1DVL4_9CYAN|nr:MFS transporter [Stenomitos frigidus]PSB24538.1 MFS transporter [Stenomitos frigidus ULC18]